MVGAVLSGESKRIKTGVIFSVDHQVKRQTAFGKGPRRHNIFRGYSSRDLKGSLILVFI